MARPVLTMCVLPGRFAICRLDPAGSVPAWATAQPFCAVARTDRELSVVCPQEQVPADVRHEAGWRVLELQGPFPLEVVGVLAAVAGPLAAAGISLFVVSTFDTDYVLVKEAHLDRAVSALGEDGHRVRF